MLATPTSRLDQYTPRVLVGFRAWGWDAGTVHSVFIKVADELSKFMTHEMLVMVRF